MKGLCSSRNQMVLSSLWPTSAIPHFCSQRSCPSEKLWLSSETCAFQKIRNLVFQTHPAKTRSLSIATRSTTCMRTSLMNQRTANGRRSHDDVLDIWLYTQAIHVGKKELEKGKTSGRFTLQDFDEWAERIGRQRFEYLLRSSLRIIAFVYIQFLKQVARPFFALLYREYGMTPGFEASAMRLAIQ